MSIISITDHDYHPPGKNLIYDLSSWKASRIFQSCLLTTEKPPKIDPGEHHVRGFLGQAWLKEFDGNWTLTSTDSYTLQRWWIPKHNVEGSSEDLIPIPYLALALCAPGLGAKKWRLTVDTEDQIVQVVRGDGNKHDFKETIFKMHDITGEGHPTFLEHVNYKGFSMIDPAGGFFDQAPIDGAVPISFTTRNVALMAGLDKIWQGIIDVQPTEPTSLKPITMRVRHEGIPDHHIACMPGKYQPPTPTGTWQPGRGPKAAG